ncbi:MAG TPA: DUF5723 family protein [Bacteroidia bacterium]|jgi:hypothetical protein|nr:DUF5723 family protein [Bacteroidia bacterium]
MRKLTTLVALTLFFPLYSFSQIDLCLPVATARGGAVTAVASDWEAIGINPANLGWKSNHKFSITILNVGLSVQSHALDFPTLKNAILNPTAPFTPEEKVSYARVFSTEDGLNLNADVNWVAFSFNIPKIGGIAINVRDRIIGHVTLSQTAADIMFNGVNSAAYKDSDVTSKKISHELAGTSVGYYHYRELNIDYGHKLFEIGGGMNASHASFEGYSFRSLGPEGNVDTSDYTALKVYGGVGFKYLWGLGNLVANITDGGLDAHSSFSTDYGINYGSIQNFSPSNVNNLFNNTGGGYALDFGLSAAYKSWKFGVSATDLGSILWKHNQLTAVDTNMPKLGASNNGINSWGGSGLDFVFANDNPINFKPGPDYTVVLPAMLRSGVSYQISKVVLLSADAVFPLNNVPGNLESPYYAVAGQITAYKSLIVYTGFAGNTTFGFNMPLGISFGFRNVLMVYIATNDILTYLVKTNNPVISFAFGMLRFNI